MHKARSGSGSIRPRKTGRLAGKWRLQYGYEEPLTGEFVSLDKTFATEREAQEFLDDVKAKLRTGQMIVEANNKRALTLEGWFDELAGTKDNKYAGRWSDEKLQTKTIAYRVGRFNNYVRRSTIGSMPLKYITADHARALFRKLYDDGVGLQTLATIRRDLVKVMNDAIETYEKLPYMRNPFRKIRIETPPPRRAVAISVKQAKKAIARQVTVKDRAFLGLLLMGGLRLSEIMALTKDQIDFKKGVLVVDRSVKVGPTGQQKIGLPKGGKPTDPKVRLVVMCPSLASLLCPLMDRPGRHLFPAATDDQPRMKKLVYATWRKIRRNSKYLPASMVIKDCRLSHNNWIEKLMPDVSLSTRLEHIGHSTKRNDSENKGLAVNLSNYTRFLSEAHDILRDELEKLMGLNGRPMLPMIDEDE